jgi:hypothetical protein
VSPRHGKDQERFDTLLMFGIVCLCLVAIILAVVMFA